MSVRYPDVSHYNAPLSLAGAPLVIAKATEGTSYTDPQYAGFKAQAGQRGIPFAAYHWINNSDPVAQARHCHSVVGSVPLMIDDEAPPISVPRTLAFVAAYRQLGGVVTLEYLPRWAWQNSGSPNLAPLAAAGLHIVSSNYTAYSDHGVGFQPYGGITPTIWQYTSSQIFNGKPCDFNGYPGTLAALLALVTGGQDPGGGAMTDASIVEALMNRTINGVRVADILGTEYGTNKALSGRLDDVDAALTALSTKLDGVAVPVTMSPEDRDAIVAAIVSAVGAMPGAADIAKAVNDDAAARRLAWH